MMRRTLRESDRGRNNRARARLYPKTIAAASAAAIDQTRDGQVGVIAG